MPIPATAITNAATTACIAASNRGKSARGRREADGQQPTSRPPVREPTGDKPACKVGGIRDAHHSDGQAAANAHVVVKVAGNRKLSGHSSDDGEPHDQQGLRA